MSQSPPPSNNPRRWTATRSCDSFKTREAVEESVPGDVLQPPPEENLVELEDAGAVDAHEDHHQHQEEPDFA